MDYHRVLKQLDQDHVLKYWNELSEEQQAVLTSQLDSLDWARLQHWIKNEVLNPPAESHFSDLAPAPYYSLIPQTEEQKILYQTAETEGRELIAAGKVAAFTVAGGQGTRLGFDAPKGMYPITPVKEKSLFQHFAESLARYREIYRAAIPWYIMTSPLNDAATRAYFRRMNYFDSNPDDVFFLIQGTMPAFTAEGKLILADKGNLALSPDGHGGSLRALSTSGALQDMKERGIEHLSYFQIDNPLVQIIDPLFIGLHALTHAEMSSRCVVKTEPMERIGVFCQWDEKIGVVEYSDLPPELNLAIDDHGNLRFAAGSPAIHLLTRTFVKRLNAGGFKLPFHRAIKKVSYVNDQGKIIEPKQPNGIKLETFIFDALRATARTIVLEMRRERQFAPTKNADGVDSVVSARALMQEEYARWLELTNVRVPRTPEGKLACELEISPRAFVNEEDFCSRFQPKLTIRPGDRIYLDHA